MRMTPGWLTALVVAASVMTTPTNAGPGKPGQQTAETFNKAITVQQTFDYLLFLPKDYDPARTDGWPMILFLHGAGERGSDLARVKIHGPSKQIAQDGGFPFLTVSPQCPSGQTWDVEALMSLVDHVVETLNVDTNRIYLTGLSMGGFGTWNLGVAHPERFAAIAPICGGGQPIAVHLSEGDHRKALEALPVWAFHGAKDPVVPLEESQRMVTAFREIGAHEVKLTIYPDALHDSWSQTYANPEFYAWLLKHSR